MRVDRSLQGIALCTLAYAFLALQDALLKWLVADYSVVTILFWRSLVVLVVCVVVGRQGLLQRVWRSSSKRLLVERGLLALVAWLLYYTAARDLSLAQMTTLYFTAPIMVTALAAIFLKEYVSRGQWVALVLGFIGVLVACKPGSMVEPLPVVLTLLAALCWAFTYIQLRWVDAQTSVLEQMLITNGVFVICTAVALPWTYTPAPMADWLGMLGAGLVGGIGQFLLFSSFQRATATLLAPFEYTGLIWAFLLSSLVWGTLIDVPLLVGAGLIALSGTLAMLCARHTGAEDTRAQAPLEPENT